MQTVDTRRGNNRTQSGGFPHSEIHGSKPIPGSPWLIAGYHVLHRLLLPRHPPNALIALDSIRKKTDPERPGRSRLESKFTLPDPRHPAGDLRSVYLTWTTPPLVHWTTAPPLGCGRQRVSLSERCEASPRGDRRPIGRRAAPGQVQPAIESERGSDGGAWRVRTADPLLAKQMLYQLS